MILVCWRDSSPPPAGFAIPANLGARNRNLDPRILGDLILQLLEKIALHFADLPAPQTRNVNMIARPMTFVVMPVAMNMQQIELIKQAHLLEHFQGAVNRDAVNSRIDLLRALEDGIRSQVPLGLVHHL